MGRLQAVAVTAVFAALLLGCDEDKVPTAARERSQAIAPAESPAIAPAKSAALAPEAAPSPTKKPRKLCEGQMAGAGKPLPDAELGRKAAPGAKLPPGQLTAGKGFTWVNFWAAWCVPCKEEIPRLVGWEKKLNTAGKSFRLVFVSLDDDERQLEEFLGQQPAGGLKSTYWLQEGEPREKWRGALGLEEDPELPQHLLIDGSGKVRCVINGAVEDGDYEQVLKLVGG